MKNFFKYLLCFILLALLVIIFWRMEKTPANVLIGVGICIVLAVLFILSVLHSARKPPAPAQPLSPPPVPEPSEPSSPEPSARKLSKARMERVFARAVKSLKQNLSGRDIYQIPWFLMLGESGSGKTELMERIRLSPLIDRRLAEAGGKAGEECRWWPFEQGVIIEPAGAILTEEEPEPRGFRGIWVRLRRRFRYQDLSGGRLWRHFLGLLLKYRPDRPIDGVILTVSCDELVYFSSEGDPARAGNGELDTEKLGEKADLLYRRIWHVQKVLGMRFPVYILVTRCQQIPGFEAFSQTLPVRGLSDHMFGWSSPYTLETAYSSNWGKEAFETLLSQLFQAQCEIYTQGVVPEKQDAFYGFPLGVQKLSQPIRIYLDRLFRKSAYHQSFVFRGLFFTGMSSGTDPESETVQPLYARELFEQKVFPEHGIAHPLAEALRFRRRRNLALQAALLLIFCLLGLGLWRDYRQFETDHAAMKRFLTEVDNNLDNVSLQIRSNNKMELFRYIMGHESMTVSFNESALKLSSDLAGVNELKFLFIPSSWQGFGRVHRTIRQSVRSAYNQIILKAMFIRMIQRARDILESPENPAPASYQYSLETLPGFGRLSRFISRLRTLEDHIALYNGMGEADNDLRDFGQVVAYLFDVDLKGDFYTRATYYTDLGKGVRQWRFDEEIFRRFKLKYARFVTDELIGDLSRSLARAEQDLPAFAVPHQLNRLAGGLEGFSRKSREAVRDPQAINDLIRLIHQTRQTLSQPVHQWLEQESIANVRPFGQLMEAIRESGFLGPQLLRELQNKSQMAFARLQDHLKRQSSGLTGPLLETRDRFPVLLLSQKVQAFADRLKKLQGYDFMAIHPAGYADIRTCPPGTRLEWNLSLLEDCLRRIREYEGFVRGEYRRYGQGFDSTVQKVAKSRMDQRVQEGVADAQHCEPLSDRFLRQHQEAVLGSEILNFKRASRLLSRLRSDCNRLDLMDAYVVISELLRWQSDHLLESVNKLLAEEQLYAIRAGDFSWWEGEDGPALALAAFEVSDKKELAYYLDMQRRRIRHLAYEYAEPVITLYLSNQMDDLTLNRWKQALAELQAYENEKPGNSVSQLEQFIRFDMNQVSPQNYSQVLSPYRAGSQRSDIFLDIRRQLADRLYQRCQTLAAQTLHQNYQRVKAFFNRKLAHKYPFARLSQESTRFAEARPEDIRDLYRLMDRHLADHQELLNLPWLFGVSGGHALDFLRQMENVRPLFAGYADPLPVPDKDDKKAAQPEAETSEADKEKPEKEKKPEKAKTLARPALDFSVRFRVNQEDEALANRIMAWTFEAGDQALEYGGDKQSGRWQWGEPVSLSLRWPRNYPGYPALPPDIAHAELKDRTIRYRFDNQWALLRMIQVHGLGDGDLPSPRDKQPHTLKFEANTVHVDLQEQTKVKPDPEAGPNTRVYIRLLLRAADGTGRQVIMDRFPVSAPALTWEGANDGGMNGPKPEQFEPERPTAGFSEQRGFASAAAAGN